MESINTLETLIRNRDRRGLGRAITLIESDSFEQKESARHLMEALCKLGRKSRRIGISGPPGVGKSSFIERLGLLLVGDGRSIAVLAIDPSSPVSGGSILGDKTRMQDLAAHERAFIRPSPSGKSTGGVARSTRESILMLEAAGFDYILVETVGVGQAEFTLESMVDLFITLHQPSSGDDLQGIKKGILELSQFVIVTKADSHLQAAAELAKAELCQSFHFLPPLIPERKILLCSAIENKGFELIFEEIESFFKDYFLSSRALLRRNSQNTAWFQQELKFQFEDLVENSKKSQAIKARYMSQLTETQAASSLASEALKEILVLLTEENPPKNPPQT